MQPKKVGKGSYYFLAIVVAYVSYLFAGGWEKGITLAEYLPKMQTIFQKPIGLYFNHYTIPFLLIGQTIVWLYSIMSIQEKSRYLPGKEYGTAKWANVRDMNRRLSDRKHPDQNRILSQKLRLSTDNKVTNINNNIFVIGGSGAGKSFFFLTPNMYQCNGSIVVTDPKGELLAKNGNILKRQGYEIKVINLVDMKKSNCYNPFRYVKSPEDVPKLITNLMANTTPKGSHSSDPFWDKAESLYLQSLFYYVLMECPAEERNFESLLKLLAKAEVLEDEQSDLDIIMAELEHEKGENHPAVMSYYKCIRGAGDTVRSIIISANSRFAYFENENLKRILREDEMELASIGTGKNGDCRTKTALFCVIPDVDKTYNFVVGLLYTQLFQILYYEADNHFDGELPIQVTFWLDEFANVALPDDFLSLLSTMRSRGISAIPIIQNLAQIKNMYKDGQWESIPGNCDTIVYLGGNEQSTHEYISKMLGKTTIYKKSQSQSKGRNGSSSQSTDAIQRDLMGPDEVRKLSRFYELVFIKGEDPVYDRKYVTLKSATFALASRLGRYQHDNGVVFDKNGTVLSKRKEDTMTILSKESLAYLEKQQENGEEVQVLELTMEDLYKMAFELESDELDLTLYSEEEELEETEEFEDDTLEQVHRKIRIKETVIDTLACNKFTAEELQEITLGIEHGLSDAQILTYIAFEEDKMRAMRIALEAHNRRQAVT